MASLGGPYCHLNQMKVDNVEKKVKMQTSHNYSASSLILRPHPFFEHGEDLLGYEPKFNTLFFSPYQVACRKEHCIPIQISYTPKFE